MSQGTIVKAAPPSHVTASGQVMATLLDWHQADPILLRTHAGPRVMFYSAGDESNVMGATADLLLEIDEARDVTREEFERDFRPMVSTNSATTVLYGTAWTDNTLLAQQRAHNLEVEDIQACAVTLNMIGEH